MGWRDEPITKGELYDAIMQTHDDFQKALGEAQLVKGAVGSEVVLMPLKVAVELLRKFGKRIEGSL